MNTSPGTPEPPQIAIWYFLAATFVFVAPTMFFRDADLWVTILLVAAGFLLIIAGGIQLGREITQRRNRNADPRERDA